MFIKKNQMVATLYTVIFHSPQAAAAFEIEVELRAGVFNLKRSITSVSFGLFEPIAGELWAKDFEARWIARLHAEMNGHGDPATPLAINESYQEPYHGSIDHVEDLLITEKDTVKKGTVKKGTVNDGQIDDYNYEVFDDPACTKP